MMTTLSLRETYTDHGVNYPGKSDNKMKVDIYLYTKQINTI